MTPMMMRRELQKNWKHHQTCLQLQGSLRNAGSNPARPDLN